MMITAEQTAAQTMRHAMITSQLRTNGVSDQRVVAAMARVPREEFVPVELRDIAYRDSVLPVGRGRGINLPMATGRLLTEANLLANDRVMLIGAAGGYTAAVLADIVTHVDAVEDDRDLLTIARAALVGDDRVTLIDAPLAAGNIEGAPYDVLVIDGAVEMIPDALLDQIVTDGRIVSGLLERGLTRLASGRKSNGGFGLMSFADCDCTILPGFARPSGFRF